MKLHFYACEKISLFYYDDVTTIGIFVLFLRRFILKGVKQNKNQMLPLNKNSPLSP